MSAQSSSGRIPVNGIEMYYEIHGQGEPLVMLHGGVNPADFFGAPLAAMAQDRQVIAIHLRGHGFSSDGEEPWSYELFADDVAELLGELGIEAVDIMGWSTGGGVALQVAIRHPQTVGKLVVISMNVHDRGNYPELQAQFDDMPGMAPEIAEQMQQSPLYAMWPDVDWEVMFRKTGEMNQGPYDWSEDVARIRAPMLWIFSDADMMYPEHIAEIYRLVGGGTRDAGLDGSLRPTPNQLAIVPGTTHYDLPLKETEAVANFANAFLEQ